MDDVLSFMRSEREAILGPAGADYTEEPVAVYGAAISYIDAMQDQLAERDAALKAADELAVQCDLFSEGKLYSMRPVLDACETYRNAREKDAPRSKG